MFYCYVLIENTHGNDNHGTGDSHINSMTFRLFYPVAKFSSADCSFCFGIRAADDFDFIAGTLSNNYLFTSFCNARGIMSEFN